MFFKNKIKNHHIPDALCCTASLVKISNKLDHISVGYIQKTAQKQPKIIPSACMKTFEISKLENYKSDIMKLRPDTYQLNTFNITKMRVSINGQVDEGRNQKNTKKCRP